MYSFGIGVLQTPDTYDLDFFLCKCDTPPLLLYKDTLIECSNRSPIHSDIYQSLAVAEQYVLYHDLEHSFWKIFTK